LFFEVTLQHNTNFRTFDKLASFDYNRVEGGEFVLKREKRYLVLDSSEWRLAIEGMNNFRSYLIQAEMPTEDENALLLKLLKTKAKRRPR
jgi:hypothetical protein